MEMYRKTPLLSTLNEYYESMHEHSKPFVKIAWTVIIVLVMGIAYMQTLSEPTNSDTPRDESGLVIMQIQAEYLLGVGAIMGDEFDTATAASILNTGSVAQRERYMAFMIGLGKPNKAIDA